jgi:uncharacterized membrane protein YhfC
MNILIVTYFLNGFLMIAMPVGLTIYLTRTFKRGWRLFWIGAGTFIFSQVLHIPFNALVAPVFGQSAFLSLPVGAQNVVLSIFYGLSAGLFEELSRYVMYRWWAKEARSWGTGLLAGAGHGGIEAIILGLLVLYGYVQLLYARSVDIASLVPAEQIDLAKSQIAAYWSAPWGMSLLGALERLFTIPLHLACSLLVLQAFTRSARKKLWWVGLAVLFHALADAAAVFASKNGLSALAIEGLVGLFAATSVAIIFALRQPEPLPDPLPGPVSVPEFQPAPVAETDENLDKTRFQ